MFIVSEKILGFVLFHWILPICRATTFPECDMQIPHGHVTWWCKQYGPLCPYSCDDGYKRHDTVSWLQCSTSGKWIPLPSKSVYGDNFSVQDLCTGPDGQQCPYDIANGHLKQGCIRDPGHSCTFECIEGYNTSLSPSIITCGSTLKWNHDPATLCQAKPCSTVISQGTLAVGCKAVVGSKCNFSCDLGYVWNIPVSELTCQTSTEWNPDIRSLCIRADGQQCPYDIDNGHLKQGCIREPGHSCTFECIEGYYTSLSPSIITCGSNLKWNHDLTTLCQDDRIPTEGLIAGITISVVIVIFIIAAIVVLKSTRSSVRKSTRNASVHTGGTPWRPRDNPLQNATTIREYNHVDVIGSTLSFGSPSYNGICAQSSVQGIAAISSNWSYREPPPSYRETQSAANELPPSYNDVVMDPTRFNLYT